MHLYNLKNGKDKTDMSKYKKSLEDEIHVNDIVEKELNKTRFEYINELPVQDNRIKSYAEYEEDIEYAKSKLREKLMTIFKNARDVNLVMAGYGPEDVLRMIQIWGKLNEELRLYDMMTPDLFRRICNQLLRKLELIEPIRGAGAMGEVAGVGDAARNEVMPAQDEVGEIPITTLSNTEYLERLNGLDVRNTTVEGLQFLYEETHRRMRNLERFGENNTEVYHTLDLVANRINIVLHNDGGFATPDNVKGEFNTPGNFGDVAVDLLHQLKDEPTEKNAPPNVLFTGYTRDQVSSMTTSGLNSHLSGQSFTIENLRSQSTEDLEFYNTLLKQKLKVISTTTPTFRTCFNVKMNIDNVIKSRRTSSPKKSPKKAKWRDTHTK